MKREDVIRDLNKLGIKVTAGKVKKSDIKEALKKVTAEEDEEDEEDKNLEWLMYELDIKADGMWVFDKYVEKYGGNQDDLDDALRILEAFVSDVEDYAMPAVNKMLDYLESLD